MAPASNLLAEFQRVRGRSASGYSPLSAEDALADDDVIGGLRRQPKRLPWQLRYDENGAALLEQITGIDDYYPARNELRLLDLHLPAIAAQIGLAARVVEPGAGGGIKTKRLLRALDQPASYIGIADIKKPFTLPPLQRPVGRTLVFFPGSGPGPGIDNVEPHEAVSLLARLRAIAGPNVRLLLGADGTHDREALLHAYDDLDGLTAELDKNVLVHVNRTCDADFDPDAFEHRAVWNATHARVELLLVASVAHHVHVGDELVAFAANEPIVTAHCYKHSLEAMRGILGAAGWTPTQVFTATEQPMRLWLCEPRGV